MLLKQDVDLGFSLISPEATAVIKKAGTIDDSEDDIQKLKALLEIKSDDEV